VVRAARAVPLAGPCDGFEVIYVGLDGARHRGPLKLCWDVSFEKVGAVRRFTSRQGQRSFCGLWYFASSGDHVGYESWLERDRLMALDADPEVVAVASQPFWLCWDDDRRVRHAPDFFVRRCDGTALVLDVRADDRVGPGDAAKFDATARACEAVGWRYRRVGALDPVLAANLRWLAGYRHGRCHQVERADQLRQVFARPTALMDGVSAVGDRWGFCRCCSTCCGVGTWRPICGQRRWARVRWCGWREVPGDGVAAAGVAHRL
jgi:hypothetical protein